MGKFKGTQGKWEVKEYRYGDLVGMKVIVDTEEGEELVVHDTGIHGYISYEQEADAKLIVASKNLLEALQHTLEILYQCDPPKELHETYANAFMNYNNLIKETLE